MELFGEESASTFVERNARVLAATPNELRENWAALVGIFGEEVCHARASRRCYDS